VRPLLAFLVALGVALPAHSGSTYLVGPSPQADFDQLTEVAPVVGPGDLVLVEGGFVYDPVLFENDGSAAEPIVVRGIRVSGR
jgi:hypothetical protein